MDKYYQETTDFSHRQTDETSLSEHHRTHREAKHPITLEYMNIQRFSQFMHVNDTYTTLNDTSITISNWILFLCMMTTLKAVHLTELTGFIFIVFRDSVHKKIHVILLIYSE